MEIVFKEGCMLEAEERWIINPVGVEYFWSNTTRKIFNKYPTAYNVYMAAKEFGGMRQGVVTFAEQEDSTCVFNAIFQLEGRRVDFESVIECAEVINKYCKTYNIPKIAIQEESISTGECATEITLEILTTAFSDVQLISYKKGTRS